MCKLIRDKVAEEETHRWINHKKGLESEAGMQTSGLVHQRRPTAHPSVAVSHLLIHQWGRWSRPVRISAEPDSPAADWFSACFLGSKDMLVEQQTPPFTGSSSCFYPLLFFSVVFYLHTLFICFFLDGWMDVWTEATVMTSAHDSIRKNLKTNAFYKNSKYPEIKTWTLRSRG